MNEKFISINKYIYVIIEIFILAITALLALTVLNTEYLFGWAAHNWKLYSVLCGTALLLFFLNKWFVSVFMSMGIATGIFVGNYLGALIKQYNESKIAENMKAEVIHRLNKHHPGFEIWISVILLFIVIEIVMHIIIRKRHKSVIK